MQDELALRNDSTAAFQALEDLKQECSQYDNQARTLESDIKQTESQLRCCFVLRSFIA
jgi:predicted  nucleic acid-binding Zn-ribbon protein